MFPTHLHENTARDGPFLNLLFKIRKHKKGAVVIVLVRREKEKEIRYVCVFVCERENEIYENYKS